MGECEIESFVKKNQGTQGYRDAFHAYSSPELVFLLEGTSECCRKGEDDLVEIVSQGRVRVLTTRHTQLLFEGK
jgi:hypothetical protein